MSVNKKMLTGGIIFLYAYLMKKPVGRNIEIEIPVHERLKAYADVKGLRLRTLATKAIGQFLDRVKTPEIK